jgi:2-succinyl-5-enolpyruvyl-6-hydroxy-3-cyclohexene-1-carboxylate synthase
LVDNYDVFLRASHMSEKLRPDLVVRFGMTPTSKALITYLGELPGAYQIGIGSDDLPNDPTRSLDEFVDADPARLASDLAGGVRPSGENDPWCDMWRRVSRTARVVVEAHLAAADELSEPAVYQVLADTLPEESLLFVGNSMPVRDMDAFFYSRQTIRTLANRGVNGIDGVTSTALGAGAALGKRVVLVIGDLSFYHDMSGLLAAKRHACDVTILLLNNDGGGIFNFLPQACEPTTFEPYFAMPTGLDFRAVAETFGGRFSRPASTRQLRSQLTESWATPGMCVIEVRTDRERNVREHQAIWSAVELALQEVGSGPG